MKKLSNLDRLRKLYKQQTLKLLTAGKCQGKKIVSFSDFLKILDKYCADKEQLDTIKNN